MKSKWLEALQETLTEQAEKVPPGWKTMKQLAAEFQLCRSQACEKVLALEKRGRIERRAFRIKCGEVIRLIPHYRLK